MSRPNYCEAGSERGKLGARRHRLARLVWHSAEPEGDFQSLVASRGGEIAIERRERDRELPVRKLKSARQMKCVHPAQKVAACEVAGPRTESQIHIKRVYGCPHVIQRPRGGGTIDAARARASSDGRTALRIRDHRRNRVLGFRYKRVNRITLRLGDN